MAFEMLDTSDEKMNPEIKAQWVAALRSGEYQQTTGVLAKETSDGSLEYCCLGVLCDLAVKAGKPISVDTHYSTSEQSDVQTYDGSMTVPPIYVQEWANLPDGNPTVPWSSNGRSGVMLAELNDGADYGLPRHTFEQIADIIEEHL